MENPRPEKVAVVDEVKERLDSTSATLLTEYRGLDVTAISELRRALRAAGGEYKIYKNTLVRFAARDLGLEIVRPIVVSGGIAHRAVETLRDAVGFRMPPPRPDVEQVVYLDHRRQVAIDILRAMIVHQPRLRPRVGV